MTHDAQSFLLQLLRDHCRKPQEQQKYPALNWQEAEYFRQSLIGYENQKHDVWPKFLSRLKSEPALASAVTQLLKDQNYLWYDHANGSQYFGNLPDNIKVLSEELALELLISLHEASEFSETISQESTPAQRSSNAASEIMYIEGKSHGNLQLARIGRVSVSRGGKTLYYRQQRLQSLKGMDQNPTITISILGTTFGSLAVAATVAIRSDHE